jgi:mono/diheme cytochrome c family protein
MLTRTIAKWIHSKAFLPVTALLILATPLIAAAGCSSSQGATLSSQPSTSTQQLTTTTVAPAPLTTTTAAPAPSTTAAAPAAAPSSTSAGAFADQGSALFNLACSNCHGNNGQGGGAPALTGSKTNLATYKTGKGLLDYIAASMPPEAPGSLTPQQAQQLAAFILVQNNLISRGAGWDPGQLTNLIVK